MERGFTREIGAVDSVGGPALTEREVLEMGKKSSKKAVNPRKIRTRSDDEIRSVVLAYNNLFKTDPFLANFMLMCSDLSEYIDIPPITDMVGLEAFIKKNQKRLEAQYVQRFKHVGLYGRAFPLPDTIPGRWGLKIPRPLRSCRFNSDLRHHINQGFAEIESVSPFVFGLTGSFTL
jgi:hypothetical protein